MHAQAGRPLSSLRNVPVFLRLMSKYWNFYGGPPSFLVMKGAAPHSLLYTPITFTPALAFTHALTNDKTLGGLYYLVLPESPKYFH